MYEIERQQKDSQRTQEAILRLLDELIDLADGDLTISATVSEDFTGAIADSINFTIDQLRQLVSRINSTAVQVSQAAQSTQQTAYHLAEASNHQAQEIAGASAAINEMAVTIDQVSANASESALVAGKSVSIANNGAKLVQNTINGMDTIREQIQDTSKRIKRLGESSQEIGDIVSLINDIADQTNILALNAAIQASMAGDAGRGFAVVADEVQRLAERSAAATKQIGTLVKAIQSDTNEAVISMEQTTSEVVRGARLAQDAGVALEEIEGVSANLAELIQNISNAARQQASSAGHISNTMNVIQEITSQTTAGTGETANSIGNLADMASELRQSVAGFTLPDEMLADLQLQEISAVRAAPPVLENTVSSAGRLSPHAGSLNTDKILSDLDFSDGDDSNSFFNELTDGEDLLDEFDIDLSDVEFPDKGTKSAR
jgi:twitching motility protein PilJ